MKTNIQTCVLLRAELTKAIICFLAFRNHKEYFEKRILYASFSFTFQRARYRKFYCKREFYETLFLQMAQKLQFNFYYPYV